MQISRYIILAVALMTVSIHASAQVIHAFEPVSVPMDSPWALGALAALVIVVIARMINKHKRFDEHPEMTIGLEYFREPRDSRLDQLLLMPFKNSSTRTAPPTSDSAVTDSFP